MKLGINGSKKEHKVRGRNYLTLMFITDATKEAKVIKISKWLRFPLLIVGVLVVVGSLSIYEYIARLEAQVVMNNLVAQEAVIDSDSKDYAITDLETELSLTKDKTFEQLVNLQEQAVKLAMRLEELEDYRSEMESFKEEIDTNLSTSDEDNKDGTDASTIDIEVAEYNSELETVTNSLRINPFGTNRMLSTNHLSDFVLAENQGGPIPDNTSDIKGVDFENEIDKINEYINIAIEEIDTKEELFLETSESLEGIIPYLEAFPSVLPIQGTYITSYFGNRKNPFGGYSSEFHTGVDLKATYEPVAATGAGVVVVSEYLSGYGYTILIDHGYGIMTKYAHNSKLYVNVGEQVKRGDVISKSGNTGRSTGPHLHYEILVDGKPQNPLDYIYKENNE
jgi:murein DD-endopeptidase MepM/ murein hydrolase activator NlpD